MTRWRRRSDVLWRTAPGYLVVGTVDGRTLEVEGPGDEVWALLETWTTERDLVAAMRRRYTAEESTVAADLRSLLDALHEAGHVEAKH